MKKPRVSDTLVAYTLQRTMMDKALEIDGLTYTCPTSAKAVAFVLACNRFRVNLRKQVAAQQIDGMGQVAETKYDILKIRRLDNRVVFEQNILEGIITDPEGNPIELDFDDTSVPEPIDEDELVNDAADAIRNLGLDIA